MSRHNKVNPGQYTQRGRLTPDDSARELVRQRSAIASQDKHQGRGPERPWMGSTAQANNDDEGEAAETEQEQPAAAEEASKPAPRRMKAKAARKPAAGMKKPAANWHIGRTTTVSF